MPHEPRPVRLRFSRTDRVLGLPIPQGEQERILISLGFEVIERAPESLLLGPPSFRTEMGREIDVIEEVARIHGYHHLPATLPGREPEIGPEDEARGLASLVTRLRAAAAAAGCHEVVNYSFLSARDNAALTIAGGSELREAQHLTISNPLSAEQAVMRNSLLVSLLGNLRHNLRFRRSDLKLYEVGRAYLLGDEGVIDEPNRFGAVLMGARSPLSWTGSTEQVDFFDVKGLVESTLQRLGIRDEDVVFEAAADAIPWLHPRSACSMHTRSRGETLGWLGEVHPKVADAFDVPRGVVCVELHIDTLRGLARLVPEHEAVPRFPAVLRDLAVVVDDDVSAGTIQELIEASLGEAEALGARVSGVTLFDVYTGPQVGEGKRSLAFAVRYEASDRTLTDAEAARVHDAIVARLQSEVGATLRA